MSDRGVDVVAYDKYVDKTEKRFFKVREGDVSVLLKEDNKKRSLLLCYPDDAESMAVYALEAFQGEHVIHVGELMMTGTLMGSPIAPYGRTSSADFQTLLSTHFHCVLVGKFPPPSLSFCCHSCTNI